MRTIPQTVCGAIPPHMLERIAAHGADPGTAAQATIAHMREIARERARTLVVKPRLALRDPQPPQRLRYVYDAQHRLHLPGKLVRTEHKDGPKDLEVQEAFDGCGATYELFWRLFHRRSVDGQGMRLDSTVHYGKRFSNAMWNGEQMIYGDGDGKIFTRFTAAIDVIAHELTHGYTQFTAGLQYFGQSGALNEHLSDAFGMMVKQWMLGQSAMQSDWLIGAELFLAHVNARGVRSMAHPGTAYDDPILGRDPQPSHMSGYVLTDEDNGGVHINSGILNRALYLAATGLGGRTWDKLGKVWFKAMTERLRPESDFHEFASVTTQLAGEMFGERVKDIVGNAWVRVGLGVSRPTATRRRAPAAAVPPLSTTGTKTERRLPS